MCLLLSMELALLNPDIVSYSSVISAAEKGAMVDEKDWLLWTYVYINLPPKKFHGSTKTVTRFIG